MLADRQELDMGEAEIPDIPRKLPGQFAIAQPLVVVLAPPRAEMHLVDRHRRAERVDASGSRARMRQCCPSSTIERCSDALGGERHRIGFQRQLVTSRGRRFRTCIDRPRQRGHEDFPVADAAHPHRMRGGLPEIEIADHADPPRIWREHHEGHAGDAVERHRVRAELVVDARWVPSPSR